jgi:GWxTD domain-containing protein
MFPAPFRNYWLPVFLVLVCVFLFVPHLLAQRRGVENLAEGPVSFYIDSANFFDPESGASRLEVYYKVAYDHLQFIKETNGYRASFKALCVVYDQKGRQVTGDVLSNTQWVKTYDETNSRQDFSQGRFPFSLTPGEYKLRVWIEGQHFGEIVSLETRATVPSFEDSTLMISDLLFVDEVISAEAGKEGPGKKELIVVPSIRGSYSDQAPQLSFYFEIYDLISDELTGAFYQVMLEVVDMNGEVALVDTSSLLRRAPLSVGRRTLVVTSLEEEGKYFLRLRVGDPKTGRSAQGGKPFTLRWSNLGRVDSNYEEAIEQLRYIAKEEEYKKLKAADKKERKEVWLKFWADRDPTPGTPENEMKDEYYRRIEYANDHFSVVGPGWKSDRGRIYIVYGRPDEIERHPMDIGLKPYEIWYYYSSNHIFYFVDENGFGDYRLVRWQ